MRGRNVHALRGFVEFELCYLVRRFGDDVLHVRLATFTGEYFFCYIERDIFKAGILSATIFIDNTQNVIFFLICTRRIDTIHIGKRAHIVRVTSLTKSGGDDLRDLCLYLPTRENVVGILLELDVFVVGFLKKGGKFGLCLRKFHVLRELVFVVVLPNAAPLGKVIVFPESL